MDQLHSLVNTAYRQAYALFYDKDLYEIGLDDRKKIQDLSRVIESYDSELDPNKLPLSTECGDPQASKQLISEHIKLLDLLDINLGCITKMLWDVEIFLPWNKLANQVRSLFCKGVDMLERLFKSSATNETKEEFVASAIEGNYYTEPSHEDNNFVRQTHRFATGLLLDKLGG